MTNADGGALSGTRVLDLSEGIAGGFAARLMGDLGADVIKIEAPRRGDKARYAEPLVPDAPEPEQSLMFQHINWNKRGITLDLSHESARPIFKKLVESADIVIETFKPGKMAEWGYSYDQLAEWNPKIVLTSITSFGQNGPYAQYDADDLIHYAMSGVAAISGRIDMEPLKHAFNQSYMDGALNAAYSTLAGLAMANSFGYGDHFDVAIQETMASMLIGPEPNYVFRGVITERPAEVKSAFSGDPLPTKEGLFTVQNSSSAPFEAFADLFELEIFRDPEFRAKSGTPEARAMIEDVLKDKTAKEWFQRGTELRIVVGTVQNAQDLLDCPQLEERGFFWEIEHPATGKYRFPAGVNRLSLTPMKLYRRSPMLGEHTNEIIHEELGVPEDDLMKLKLAGVV
jgi:crotonobetainyl-CoA:carnitine CoA-transferase CaiB-like acyl-CoA transferase